jgi:hypothetical protein
MSQPSLRYRLLENSGDERGLSFQTGPQWIAFLGKLDDAHIATILPGSSRGNHYHLQRREVIAVLFTDEWQLAWDQGMGTAVSVKQFSGAGAVLVEVDPGASHAIANTGKELLWIVGLSNGAWDPRAPDSYPRKLLPQP